MTLFNLRKHSTTANQKQIVSNFVGRHVDSRKVVRYDHAISFFMTIWGALWFLYLLIIRNLLPPSYLRVISQIIDIFGFAVTGVF
jgi:hypothetical protein